MQIKVSTWILDDSPRIFILHIIKQISKRYRQKPSLLRCDLLHVRTVLVVVGSPRSVRPQTGEPTHRFSA